LTSFSDKTERPMPVTSQ